jgi:hypothetical protein
VAIRYAQRCQYVVPGAKESIYRATNPGILCIDCNPGSFEVQMTTDLGWLQPGDAYRATGPNKLAQRYAVELLGILGSTGFDAQAGTELIPGFISGMGSQQIVSAFIVASSKAIDRLALDSSDSSYGAPVADEIPVKAELRSYSYDKASSSVVLHITLYSQSGQQDLDLNPSINPEA